VQWRLSGRHGAGQTKQSPPKAPILTRDCQFREITMSDPLTNSSSSRPREVPLGRITVLEIARRLNIGRQAVYAMLKQGVIPALRIGRRWIVTRHAYEQWERTCGMRAGAGLVAQPEVTVWN